MPLLKSAQARFLGLLASLWLGVFVVTRSILLLTHLGEAQLSASRRDALTPKRVRGREGRVTA